MQDLSILTSDILVLSLRATLSDRPLAMSVVDELARRLRNAEKHFEDMFGEYQQEDCKKEQFMDDPMTVAYGVGSEMVDLVRCHCPTCMGDGP